MALVWFRLPPQMSSVDDSSVSACCSARQTAPGRGRRALAAHWRASGGNRRKEKSCYVGVTGLAGCMLMTRDRLLVVQSCQGHKVTESLAHARMDG